MRAIALKTEYLENPMGIDIENPRLMWKAEGTGYQTAAEIEYMVNRTTIAERQSFEGNQMHLQCSLALKSRDEVQWRVRLADESGSFGEWSGWASFEMGLLEMRDWEAKWIMGNYEHDKKPEVRYPADCFQKSFSLERKPCKARLYISACGMYEAVLNGKKVGERVLAPGSTAFQKRVHYQVYDVAGLLETENTLTLELADGFYTSKTGCFNKAKVFGHEPKVIAQLEMTDEDGDICKIVTDKKFLWSNDGPIRYADMKDGEDIDSRKNPTYSGFARETAYEGTVCADNNVEVHEKETFSVKQVIHCPDGHTVLDFGQNLAGYVTFSIKGGSGYTARMVLGEKLDENGNFTTKNISLKGDYTEERLQTVCYTCNGNRNIYKTKFAVMGFQYALLLDWPEEIVPENFTAIAVYSDMAVTGEFDSSDEGINQIVKNTLWSMKGNFLDVPTDCPTRERAGWTGDAQLFFQTGNYLMDQRAFFRKWFWDVSDCQKSDGKIYNINPANPKSSALVEWFSVEGGVGWGDAFLMIPYYFWKRYGDDSLIRLHWKNMKRCFAFYEKRVGRRNLFTLFLPKKGKHSRYLCACGRDFGEWTEPAECAQGKMSLLFPHPEESTAYIAYDAALMSEMALHMGESAESKRLGELAEHLRETYEAYFLSEDKEENRLCKYARPCGLHLVEGEKRKGILKKLVKLNRERNYRIGTGFLSTPFVLELLTEAGVPEDAYQTLTNPDFGWMQQIQAGATTVWENWTNDASLNHYSKGACCQWLFDCVCGIRLDGRENHFVIAPHVVPQIEEISFAYDSVYGKVKSGWKQENGGCRYQISVPDNCKATVRIPGMEVQELEHGVYEFNSGGQSAQIIP